MSQGGLLRKGNRKWTVWRDDKEATKQIYCHMLVEAFLITTGEVQGDDVTPLCKVKVRSWSSPEGFFFFSSEQSVNLYSPLIFSVSGVRYLSVVLATQAVRKMWRWIGFRSSAFTPVGLLYWLLWGFFHKRPELLQMFFAIVFQAVVHIRLLHYMYLKAIVTSYFAD